ncbi:zinc-dependent alcohol dehydrogenase [Prauserella cavernicola]|uniref:Alcohol dehydrogenase catalytic domain-containing protein n=1 Tax=Prauserella cavernicola TaxID=2800127 RepID=A0A934V777_9PSEU|nr:alcohol dehydrogenase catalytic domain-containing protein [Prauserella cavernicola]MBK1788292.1 alcohol dehydrogenase catalytic domain-containing protein [Prauserella cavernicola]
MDWTNLGSRRRMAVYVEGPGHWRWDRTAGCDDQYWHGDAPLVTAAVHSAGICGTDLSVLAGSDPDARYPLVLGHECLVQIADPGASGLRRGHHALVLPSVACGGCAPCLAGEDDCATPAMLGRTHPYGCFRPTLTLPATQLMPVPRGAAERAGPLLEPFARAVRILRQAAATPADRLLVFGAGVAGLTVAVAAKALGLPAPVLLDRFADRGEIATRCGLPSVVTLGGQLDAAYWRDLGPASIVVDTVSSRASATASLAVLAPRGRYVAVGPPHARHDVAVSGDLPRAHGVSVIAAGRSMRADFAEAIRLANRPGVDLAPLVTGHYPFDEFQLATRELTRRPERHVKILLQP